MQGAQNDAGNVTVPADGADGGLQLERKVRPVQFPTQVGRMESCCIRRASLSVTRTAWAREAS
jgi:hypothetical protein